MRPYLTILKDSFREAMVSRVLWVMLVLATLMLAMILPLSLTEEVAYLFQPSDIPNATILAGRIKAEHDGDRPAPGKQVWPLLQGETKDRFEEADDDSSSPPPVAVEFGEYFGAIPFSLDLDELLAKPELWDEEAWAGITLTAEASELVERGPSRLNKEKLGRLNRLLLEAAYPGLIARSQTTILQVSYFGSPEWGLQWTIDGALKDWLKRFIKYGIGVLGVIISIFVTSAIIPNTFEAGSIDLLLSKPVSRPLVYLTKFTGGCAFILLLSAYLVGGLWLITGLRYGFWSGRLLWCIPVLMFLFAVYYSVSALAGLIWKNAIVAVVISVVFWGACFLMWGGKTLCDLYLTMRRVASIIETDQGVFVYREGSLYGDFHYERWVSDSENWDPRPKIGFPENAPIGSSLSSIQGGFVQMHQIRFAAPDGKIISVRGDGVFQSDEFGGYEYDLSMDSAEAEDKADSEAEDAENHDQDGAAQERRVAPAFALSSPFAAAMNPQTADLVIFDRTHLIQLKRNDQGTYDAGAFVEIPGQKAGVVGFGGSTIVLATADGKIRLYDAPSLELRSEFQPEAQTPPFTAQASADGRYVAVLFHHDVLWLYDTEQEQTVGGIGDQGDIASVAFSRSDELLVAHHFTDVTRYELDSLKEVDTFSPELKGFDKFYWYVVRVIYNVFPKPGELDDTVAYMIDGSKSGEPRIIPIPSDDLRSRQSHRRLNIWPPVWSNLAFMVLMLGLGCWYVQRKDF